MCVCACSVRCVAQLPSFERALGLDSRGRPTRDDTKPNVLSVWERTRRMTTGAGARHLSGNASGPEVPVLSLYAMS